ncbi:hypothetical protein EMCRGX_G017819 [Ephydatia muelleri]
MRSDESTFVWTTLLFSLVAIARFESPFFRHFKAIRSCACFVRSTFRYVSLKMMRTVGRHFGVVKLVPLRPGWVPTRLDLLTQGPKPGPASWLGMQVTQWVANATIWCLSPQVSPNDLTSHTWLGHRDSQLVTSVTHESSPQPTGRGWQNDSSEGFLPWPPISQLGTF